MGNKHNDQTGDADMASGSHHSSVYNDYLAPFLVGATHETGSASDRRSCRNADGNDNDASVSADDSHRGTRRDKTVSDDQASTPDSVSNSGDNHYSLTVQVTDSVSIQGTQQIAAATSASSPVMGNLGQYDNILYGTSGNDNMVGTWANDVFVPGGGFDKIDGGSGYDTLDCFSASTGYYVLLSDYANQSFARPLDRAMVAVNGITMNSIEGVIGSLYNDKLIGNNGENFFMGCHGSDWIEGRGGSDTVSYANYYKVGYTVVLGDGNAAGYSMANGASSQEDTLFQIENIIGTRVNDTLIGNSISNILDGAYGDDDLQGRGGGDIYVFDKKGTTSFGNDRISNTGGEGDNDCILLTGDGMRQENVWFSLSGKDLLIEFVGSNDSIRVSNWFDNSGARVDYITINHAQKISSNDVEKLRIAMTNVLASYGGDVTGSDYLGVNPNIDNATLASLVASSWQ